MAPCELHAGNARRRSGVGDGADSLERRAEPRGARGSGRPCRRPPPRSAPRGEACSAPRPEGRGEVGRRGPADSPRRSARGSLYRLAADARGPRPVRSDPRSPRVERRGVDRGDAARGFLSAVSRLPGAGAPCHRRGPAAAGAPWCRRPAADDRIAGAALGPRVRKDRRDDACRSDSPRRLRPGGASATFGGLAPRAVRKALARRCAHGRGV